MAVYASLRHENVVRFCSICTGRCCMFWLTIIFGHQNGYIRVMNLTAGTINTGTINYVTGTGRASYVRRHTCMCWSAAAWCKSARVNHTLIYARPAARPCIQHCAEGRQQHYAQRTRLLGSDAGDVLKSGVCSQVLQVMLGGLYGNVRKSGKAL